MGRRKVLLYKDKRRNSFSHGGNVLYSDCIDVNILVVALN